MRRFQLIEIHDQSWCPDAVRSAVTDFLQFTMATAKPYAAMVPILASALDRAGARQVLDLGSGGGGPWLWLLPVLFDQGVEVSVCLTDKYPNPDAFSRSGPPTRQAIRYHTQPVEATRVPVELTGFRTMFTAFHHLTPEQAIEALTDAVQRREGIAVFEVARRNVPALVFALLLPVMALFMTPFIRPFRWSRLFWTYLIPVVPLIVLFDGVVSCLRTYGIAELRDLTARLGTTDYQWEIGTTPGAMGRNPITYLIGTPIAQAAPVTTPSGLPR